MGYVIAAVLGMFFSAIVNHNHTPKAEALATNPPEIVQIQK